MPYVDNQKMYNKVSSIDFLTTFMLGVRWEIMSLTLVILYYTIYN
jgi:hypothetical protein